MAMELLNKLLTSLKSTFQERSKEASSSDIEGLKKVTAELDHMDPEQAHYLAAFSHILFRVAHADAHVSDEERDHIQGHLVKFGHLTEAQAYVVTELAHTHNKILGGIDNFLVTREFKKVSSLEQKIELLHSLFAVAAADDSISNEESDMIRKISIELGLSHDQFILARQKYLEFLEALK